MDLTFEELKCPKCNTSLFSGSTQVSDDVQMVKKCTSECGFWMIIVIPDEKYDYTVRKDRKQPTKQE